ncbi:MAG: hypothetical protein A3K19_33710 [Lentisphaerae bacterium RIFOXYB12_FULL_65_16]|nr:MAG: hypothetical protein A3K19_30315 [Lentisphaerae bacterium RIFOXYB12_FULL_65_16]OGV95391.1 MAG: hypothetical protein A3K19_33710 [Lentisphaerae bacterium RIFOXYB12_FULL_65_16]
MLENPLDVVANPDLRRKIEQELFEGFRPERSPEERTVEMLEHRMRALTEAIQSASDLWMPPAQTCPPRAGADDEVG